MSLKNHGRINWEVSRDKDGHRDYKIQWFIEDTTAGMGPQSIYGAPGIPGIGTPWAYGGDNDPFAFCWPITKASPITTKDPSQWWIVENLFSTKPLRRCQDTEPGNPLTEPDRIRGTFVKYTQAVTRNKDDEFLKSSSHEPLTGPLMEFDNNRPSVSITKNLANLPLSTFAPMVDQVNDTPMWGVGRRMVKLSNATWERFFYGSCNKFYTVTYDFDVDFTTFDRKAIDQGTRILSDGGDPNNPDDFEVYKDVNGENSAVLLNGAGGVLGDASAPVEIDIEYYQETNFFVLGLPTSF